MKALLLFFLPLMAFAQDTETPKSTEPRLGFMFRKGISIEKYSGNPDGISSENLSPALFTVGGLLVIEREEMNNIYANIDATYLKNSGLIFFGEGAFGLGRRPWQIQLGVAAQYSNLSGGAFQKSAFDHYSLAGFVRPKYFYKFLDTQLEFRYRDISSSEISSTEGITTKIEHQPDRIFRAQLGGTFSIARIFAGYSWYFLGTTAIASKEFGFRINEKLVEQSVLGLTLDLKPMELGLYYYQVFKVDDEEAHLYQAPHFHPDYLVGKRSVFLEAKWLF